MSTSKPRVALFLPGLYEGGAERIVLNLADGIAARGYPVDLVLARAEGPYMPQVPRSVRLVGLEAPRVLGSVPAGPPKGAALEAGLGFAVGCCALCA